MEDNSWLRSCSEIRNFSSGIIVDNRRKNVGWTSLLVIAGVSTTIGSSVPIGWTIGVLNAPSGVIKEWMKQSLVSRYDANVSDRLLEMIWSVIVSIFLIGGMIGSFTGAWLANKIGRKRALMVASLISFVTAVMFVASKPLNSLELLLMARFFAGISSGLSMTVMPTYVSEIAPLELRGAVGVLCPLGVCFGVVFAQVLGLPHFLGNVTYWHFLLGFYGLLTIIGAIGFPFIPESPKYLYIVRGYKQEAVKELCRLRNLPEEFVCCELEDAGESSGEVWSFVRVISTRDLWLNISLVCAFNFGQQFSGINAVFYYSMSIFMGAGLSEENALYASLATGVMNFAIAVIMIPIINLFPRRGIALTSCCLATAFLVLLSFSISFMKTVPWLSYVSIIAVLAYVLVYGIGLGPIPYFVGTELFDVGPRPIAMAMGTAANWIGNLTIGLFFLEMQAAMGAYSFLVFAFSTALLTLFVKISLPETNVVIIAKRRRASLPPVAHSEKN